MASTWYILKLGFLPEEVVKLGAINWAFRGYFSSPNTLSYKVIESLCVWPKNYPFIVFEYLSIKAEYILPQSSLQCWEEIWPIIYTFSWFYSEDFSSFSINWSIFPGSVGLGIKNIFFISQAKVFRDIIFKFRSLLYYA